MGVSTKLDGASHNTSLAQLSRTATSVSPALLKPLDEEVNTAIRGLGEHFDELETTPDDAKFALAYVYCLEDRFRRYHVSNVAHKKFELYLAEQERQRVVWQSISNELNQLSNSLRLQQIENRQKQIESQQRYQQQQIQFQKIQQQNQGTGTLQLLPTY